MKKFVTVATLKGSEKTEILAGPEVPFATQRDAFRKLKTTPEHAKYSGSSLYELVEVGRAKFNRQPLQVIEAPKDSKESRKTKAPKDSKAQPKQPTESKNENS